MTWADALKALQAKPGASRARNPDMSRGWYVYWTNDNGGYHYHVNPHTGSRSLFLVDENRKDWSIGYPPERTTT